MSALSDYVESGLLDHIFRGGSFAKPSYLAIALCSGVPQDGDTGETIPELPELYSDGVTRTGYARIPIGPPAQSGDSFWKFYEEDFAAGSGVIKNCDKIIWNMAERDPNNTDFGWGWVSGVAIVDDWRVGSGNVIMRSELDNKRIVYAADTLMFSEEKLLISFK
jgi:hypothetical protein